MNDVDLSPRTRLSRARALLPTTVAVLVAIFAVGALDHTRPASISASASPAASRRAANDVGEARIVLRLSGGAATATLEDTPAAREFAAQLPMQLTLHDPMGQAKSGPLPIPLAVTAGERVTDPVTAGLYYWPLGGHLAIFYDDLGQTVPPPGLIQLGTVTSGLDTIASAGSRFTVSIEPS